MIAGQHGIDDVRQLMRTAEFRMDRAQALINRLPFSSENVALVKEWDDFVDVRWKNAHDRVLANLVTLRLDQPLVVESLLPAEAEFQIILKAINTVPGKTQTGDLTDLINRLQAASGVQLDETGHPLPPDFDPDLEVFQRADAATKQGEAAVKALEASLPGVGLPSINVAAKVPWWAWAFGAAVVGGVGYSVYKTGTQVTEKARRDTRYIHENMTSKVLPGYKG